MRRYFLHVAVACLITLASLSAAAAPVEVFTVENKLARWKGYGLRDAQGHVLLAPGWLPITPLKGGGFLQGGPYRGARLFDAQGRPVGGHYESLERIDPELDVLVLKVAGKSGLIDGQGRIVVEPVHSTFDYLKDTGLFRFERARRSGALDARGRTILPAEYDHLRAVAGVLVAAKRGHVGVFDRRGAVLAPLGSELMYDDVDGRPDRLVACRSSEGDRSPTGSCRVLDERLQPALPGEYDRVTYLADSKQWLVTLPTKSTADAEDDEAPYEPWEVDAYEILDDGGKRIAAFEAKQVSAAGNRLIVSLPGPEDSYSDRYGLMDHSGRWLAPAKFSRIETMSTAMAYGLVIRDKSEIQHEYAVAVAGKARGEDLWGVVSADGQQILAPAYERIGAHYPTLGLYLVKQGGKLGVVDRNGSWRIAPTLDETAPNSNLPLPYLMLTRRDPAAKESWRGYDHLYNLETGKPVFQDRYDYLTIDYNYWPTELKLPWTEFAIVRAKRDGKYGVLDLQGRVVQPFVHDNLNSPDPWGRFTPYRDGKRVDAAIDGLDPARRARLHEAVSRQIRIEHAPVADAVAPAAGRYVAVDYDSADKVDAAMKAKRLTRPTAPMLLLDTESAILDVGMVASAAGHDFDYLQYYCPRENGFDILMPGADVSEKACQQNPASPALVFRTQPNAEWECNTCTDFGLPTRWRRTDPGPMEK